ncbi:MAG: bifunctional [glutamate--ammonia ligase]-adenylyl-L-tyrosine phosphorylase/[glutamate--ammonia-ligase] adenylyltransferase [Duodenibacillus sp.]|nr:bifunctional [glutamate--ammonia ligase]-adenylyl-L-tyrosine phosphorylase/[glutamate--ammonia-ligase] adenylyltransferase [Duodenibacillus sp.]
MSRLELGQVPEHSFFIKRTLPALRFGADDGEQMALFSALAAGPVTRERMAERLAGCEDGEDLARRMRWLRRDALVALVGRDATGACGFEEVVRTMTDLAEVTVDATVRLHARELARRHGVPLSAAGEPQDLIVVGMGKLGGEELNVSSDIDLIFLYDEDGETGDFGAFRARRPVSNHEFFTKLAKRVIPALNDVEGSGFVFRVDMRLRPFGDAGPIVSNSAMLEEYLYTEGREWERFAWLKARAVNRPVFGTDAGFEQAVRNFRSLVRPFVYRKYVDFSAVQALSRLHALIRTETSRREAGRDLGVNVKLGSGGIREIEFIAQTFQIIKGGREPALRGRSTLPTLRALARLGVIEEATAERLCEHYVFLRNLEHAIQYVDDQQTQLLPPEAGAQENIARLLGMQREAMNARLAEARAYVTSVFDGIFHTRGSDGADGWPVGWRNGDEAAARIIAERLQQLSYRDAEGLASRICRLFGTRLRAARSQDAREHYGRFIVHCAGQCHAWARLKNSTVDADEVFHRYLALLEVVAGRTTYVALLNQYPAVAQKVGHIMALSRWAADYLTAHPLLLDELVDVREHKLDDYTPVDWSGWLENLRSAILGLAGDQEGQLNLLRDAHHGAVFRLLMADLDGRLTVERLADHLSALADAVIELVIDVAWQSLPGRHRDRPRFAVAGYGKLGGKELSYASDLDLVFLYDDDDPAAGTVYAKLVRRITSWLTVQTSSGILFEIDTRLRPNGQDGLAATSMAMFRSYQRSEDGRGAWPWEHQALTRARFCAGDPDVGRAFEAERAHILALPRDEAATAAEVAAMRGRMLDGHPNASGLFDVKHDRGGMVDVEFAVQHLVLAHAHAHPELVNNFGNRLLLEMAASAGLIDAQLARDAGAAYHRFRFIQREIRLSRGQDAKARVDEAMVAAERDAVLRLWRQVFGDEGPKRKA